MRNKFKAWDTENKTMLLPYIHDGYLIGLEGKIFLLTDNYEFVEQKHLILLPYTGLRDTTKKRKEIYKKDIVEYSISKTQHYRGIIEWRDCSFVIHYLWEKKDECILEKGYEWSLRNGYHRLTEKFKLKVIGNGFENPKLLR